MYIIQLLLPPPVQISLPKQMGRRDSNTATVFGSEPNLRMMVMFGGRREFPGDPVAETTLLHLGEYTVWNIYCTSCMDAN